MLIDLFNRTIEIYIAQLERYTFAQLCTKPSPASWSLGQMYNHIIDDGTWYVEQVKQCVATNDHADEEALPMGKTMLRNNDFPNEILKGAPGNDGIPQPESKEQLMKDLLTLKAETNRAATLMANRTFNGKTKHPGFGYFAAEEWLQFAEMHLRHHLRQKERIDTFLNAIGAGEKKGRD